MKVYDLDANMLIGRMAEELKKDSAIKPPEFAGYVKTGPHVEHEPEDKDFWYIRCASILRQAYIRGKISTGGLRMHYGGRARHRVKSAHHMDSGGSIIRKAMQQLENGEYIKKEEKGRVLTSKGRKFIDGVCGKMKGM